MTHTPEIFCVIQSNCNVNGHCDSPFSLKRMNEWKADGWTELGMKGGTGSYRSEGGRGLTMISHIGQKHATLSIPLLFPPLFFFYEKDIDGSLPSSHCLSYSCTSWPVRLSASCQRREQARVTTVQVFKGTPSLDLETSVIILRKSLTLKKFYVLSIQCIYMFNMNHRTQFILLYSINLLVFKSYVYCAVRLYSL